MIHPLLASEDRCRGFHLHRIDLKIDDRADQVVFTLPESTDAFGLLVCVRDTRHDSANGPVTPDSIAAPSLLGTMGG